MNPIEYELNIRHSIRIIKKQRKQIQELEYLMSSIKIKTVFLLLVNLIKLKIWKKL